MSILSDQVRSLRNKIVEAKAPPDLEARVRDNLEEITRLETDITARVHIEQMLRYIDWVVNLPWNRRSIDVLDLSTSRKIFNSHHYGLDLIKNKILEYLAVLKL